MSLPRLIGLLGGPFVQVLHDEKRNGTFTVLMQSQPLPMLNHFSSVIRQQSSDISYLNHQPWSQPHPQHGLPPPPTPPTAIRLSGGDGRSIIDIITWMTECCRKSTILPLRTVLDCPVRHILAMDSVQKLGVEHLSHELPQMIARLQYELFDVRTVGRIFSGGSAVLPQIMDAICLCVARYFFHGSLPEVERWMSLARLNERFDQGVRGWLVPGALQEGPDMFGAASLWERKSPSTYPAAWHRNMKPVPPLQLPYRPSTSRDWSQPDTNGSGPAPTSMQDYPNYVAPPRDDHPYGQYQNQAPPSWPLPAATPPPPPLPPKPAAYHAPYLSQAPSYPATEPFPPYATPQHSDVPYRPRQASYSPHHEPHYYRPPSPVPEYTLRCSYCHDICPQSAAAAHQCMAGRAYTVPDATSPPLMYSQPRHRSRSRSMRRTRSISRHNPLRGRSIDPLDSYVVDDEDDEPVWDDYDPQGRSTSRQAPSKRRRASTPYPQWDPAYEPPHPGEYLRERQQIGPDHFLHFFVDAYGRARVVNKQGDVAVEDRPW